MTHSSASPPPLTDPQIETLVGQYVREMARFEKAAGFVAERLRRELRAAALRHLLAFRAKHPDELRAKLRRKAADPRYAFGALAADLGAVVTDLAGCRVVVYHPDDEARVAGLVRRALTLAARPDAEECHRKPSGYRATHLLVRVPDEPDTYSIQGTVGEVQVTSLAAHLFNELEHDIGYKDHGTAPTPPERAAIDELRHGTLILDRMAARVLDARAAGVAQHDAARRRRVAAARARAGRGATAAGRLRAAVPDARVGRAAADGDRRGAARSRRGAPRTRPRARRHARAARRRRCDRLYARDLRGFSGGVRRARAELARPGDPAQAGDPAGGAARRGAERRWLN